MYKKKRFFRKLLIAIPFCVLTANADAGIQFNKGDINNLNEVLFTIKHETTGLNTYSTVFKATIKNGEPLTRPEILTCYPEQMELLDGGKILQIRNRYGIVWFDTEKNTFEWKERSVHIPETICRTPPYSVSPNGKWMCFVDKQNYASGKLTLKNALNGKSLVLSENAAFSYKTVPVKWQNDSSIFLYEKNGAIYFCNPDALFKGVEVAENYRKIGNGSISSVNLAGEKNIIYIDNDVVYKIGTKELYTRGLYAEIIGKGTAIGRIPFNFNQEKDSFSVNSDMTALVLIQSGKHFSLFTLKGNTGEYLDAAISRPYSGIQGSFLESMILWTKKNSLFPSIADADKNPPVVWLCTLPYNNTIPYSSVFHINEKSNKIIETESSKAPVLSPDGSKCAFFHDTTVYVYDTATWENIGKASGEQTISAVWENNDSLILGGDNTIRRWLVEKNDISILMLSQADNAQWTGANSIEAYCDNGKKYSFGDDRQWKEFISNKIRKNTTQNLEYRLFCGDAMNSNYENALYIRTLKENPVTKPMIQESIKTHKAKNQVALIFDAYENADGLAQILYALGMHKVSGTFFLNGEFIRRYPNETRQIAISNNECASLFFTATPLQNKDFIIDEDFVRRGLARNEDEFFKTTGKELSLLWHAPYYQKSERMVTAAKSAGYTYIEPSLNSFDSTTLEDAAASRGTYYTPAELIDLYMANATKSKTCIIPISVGISRGTRSGYLYDNMDLLINAILDSGFEIVPVRIFTN